MFYNNFVEWGAVLIDYMTKDMKVVVDKDNSWEGIQDGKFLVAYFDHATNKGFICDELFS